MNNGKRQNSILSMLALIVIALGVFAYWQQDLPGTTEKLDYSKLVKNINEDKIKEISNNMNINMFHKFCHKR